MIRERKREPPSFHILFFMQQNKQAINDKNIISKAERTYLFYD